VAFRFLQKFIALGRPFLGGGGVTAGMGDLGEGVVVCLSISHRTHFYLSAAAEPTTIVNRLFLMPARTAARAGQSRTGVVQSWG
jgi:hypothetical protein